MKGLNLQKFYKVAEDEHTTTMKHPYGHSITIAHRKVDKKLRDQLKALKLTKMKEEEEKKPADDAQTAMPPAEAEEQYAQGGEIPQSNPKLEQSKKQPPGPKYQEQPAYKNPGKPRSGVSPRDMYPEKYDEQGRRKLAGGTTDGPLQADATDAPPDQPPPADASVPQDTSSPAEREQQQQPDAATDATPQPATPDAEHPLAEHPLAGQHFDPAQMGAHIGQDLLQSRQAFQEDMQNGHVTPETYHTLYAKKDTLGKIGTIFGLMLGGIGSGITGQPNAMLQMMDKTIERDMDAQKASKANAQNFLRIHQQQALNDAHIANQNAQTTGQQLQNHKQQWINQQLGIPEQKARMDIESAAAHSIQSQANALPPNTPVGQKAQAIAGALKQQVDQRHAAMIQNTSGQAQALAAAPGFMDRINAFRQAMQGNQGAPGQGALDAFLHPPSTNAQPADATPPAAAPEPTAQEIAATKESNHLLTPDAENRMNHLTQGVKLEGLSGQKGLADPDYDRVSKAYETVNAADRALDDASDSYGRLKKLSSPEVAILANLSPGALGGILAAAGGATGAAIAGMKGAEVGAGAGGALGGALGKLKETLGPDKYREYMATLAELDTNISNAMPGLPPSQRLDIIHDILPNYKDSADTDKAKRHALVEKVHSGVRNETALLRRKGMAK